MQLKQYLLQNKIGVSELAENLEVSQSVCSMWTNNQRIPSKDNMQKIFAYTNGAVTPNDFFIPESKKDD